MVERRRNLIAMFHKIRALFIAKILRSANDFLGTFQEEYSYLVIKDLLSIYLD